MAGQYRFKDSNGNIVAQISASVGGAIAFSGSVVDFTQANNVILGNVQLAGTASNALLLNGYNAQSFTLTSSIHPFTASIAGTNTFTSSASTRLNSIETITASNISRLNAVEIVSASNIARIGSLETTSASVNTTNTTQNTRLTNLENKTGSLATTGSNTFSGDQIISGTVYIQNNLVVQGSSSLQNITASAVSIGTNTILLNTATPSIRFAGISAIDSGSAAGKSGSLYFDSTDNEWIFVHQGNTAVTSSVMITGPETYDSVGNETRLTTNVIPKSTNSFHITDSCIFDNGTTTCIKNNLVAGVGNFSNCLTFGDWTTSANVLSSNKPNEQGAYIRAAVSTAQYPTYAFQDDSCSGMYRNSTNSLGFATSGSARMIISCTGLVGIGATPLTATSAILQIEQAQSNIVAIRRADCSNTGNARILFQGYNASGVLQNTGIVEAGLDSSATAGYLGFYAGTPANPHMKITSCGRVGIGTTDTSFGMLSLMCADNTVIGSTEWGTSAASNFNLALYNTSQCVGSAAGLRLITRSSGASIWNIYNISTGASSGDLAFGNGSGGTGTEKMRITNSGLIGMNQPSPTYRLEICSPSSTCLLGLMGANGVNIDMVGYGTSLTYPQSRIQMNDDGFYGGNLSFFTKANGAQANGLNERMTIKSTGITCFACQICAPYYAGGTSYTIDFLVVAGGGGGGGSEMSNGYGGGGGAGGGGGYLASSISVNCGSSYPIVVGTGGIGGVSCLAPNGSGKPGSPGTFSSAFGFIAIGGGGGAGDEGGSTFNSTACQTGGSGGGQGGDGGGVVGIAVIGQGNNGGPNVSRTGGGGGGAGAGTGGNTGGSGRQWLDGNYYAGGGGGGGGGNDQTQWQGGAGGGGAGSRSYPGGGTSGEAGGQAVAGAACSGGGGGGAGSGYLQGGMAGGSGVVIIRYFGGTRASGGTITSSGGYTYHKFGAAGTFTA